MVRTAYLRKSITAQLLAVAIVVAPHLAQAVATKLFAHRVGQGERRHGFANNARRRYHSDV